LISRHIFNSSFFFLSPGYLGPTSHGTTYLNSTVDTKYQTVATVVDSLTVGGLTFRASSCGNDLLILPLG